MRVVAGLDHQLRQRLEKQLIHDLHPITVFQIDEFGFDLFLTFKLFGYRVIVVIEAAHELALL